MGNLSPPPSVHRAWTIVKSVVCFPSFLLTALWTRPTPLEASLWRVHRAAVATSDGVKHLGKTNQAGAVLKREMSASPRVYWMLASRPFLQTHWTAGDFTDEGVADAVAEWTKWELIRAQPVQYAWRKHPWYIPAGFFLISGAVARAAGDRLKTPWLFLNALHLGWSMGHYRVANRLADQLVEFVQ